MLLFLFLSVQKSEKQHGRTKTEIMTAIIKLSVSQVPPGGEPVKLSLTDLKC